MGTAVAPPKHRVLLVQSAGDPDALLLEQLRSNGYEAKALSSSPEVQSEIERWRPDLLLIDSDVAGFEVCRRVRAMANGPRPPVIVLSSKADEIDRVVAFEIGADDYVVKPFSVRELVLRVRARLGPAHSQPASAPASQTQLIARFSDGPLEIDFERFRVTVEGKEVSLSPLEMHLLRQLAAGGGAVCSRRDLLTRVWNYDPDTTSRTVDTHIKRLREKLGPAGELIRTVRGRGYRLVQPQERAPSTERSVPAA